MIKFRRLILQSNYIFLLLALGFLGGSVVSDGIFAPLEIIYAVLGLVVVAFIFFMAFKQIMFKAYLGMLLLLAGLCVTYIFVNPVMDNPEYLLEDGTKWLGIACWCSYYVHTSYQFITGDLSSNSNNQQIYMETELPVGP